MIELSSGERSCIPAACYPLQGAAQYNTEALAADVGEGQHLGISSISLNAFYHSNRSRLSHHLTGTTIIMPVPWSDYSDRQFQEERIEAIAEATSSRVISVDFPGIGPISEPFTKEQRRAALGKNEETPLDERGFAVAGRLAWRALQWYDRRILEDDLLILGFSQGASTAVGMLQTRPEAAKIGDVMLWEGAGWQQQKVGALALKFAVNGSKDQDYYHSLNPEWVEGDSSTRLVPQLLRQSSDHLLPVRMMAQGRDLAALEYAVKERELRSTRIHLINGTESTVSPTDVNNKVAESLRRLGHWDVHRVLHNREYHGIHNAFPFIANICRHVVRMRY